MFLKGDSRGKLTKVHRKFNLKKKPVTRLFNSSGEPDSKSTGFPWKLTARSKIKYYMYYIGTVFILIEFQKKCSTSTWNLHNE